MKKFLLKNIIHFFRACVNEYCMNNRMDINRMFMARSALSGVIYMRFTCFKNGFSLLTLKHIFSVFTEGILPLKLKHKLGS